MAALAARAPLVSVTVMAMKFTGEVVPFTVSEGVVTTRSSRRLRTVSPSPTSLAACLRVASLVTICWAALGLEFTPAMALPLASVGWPR